jgi:hemerythrin
MKKKKGVEPAEVPYKVGWEEGLMTTGVPEIDRQHREWIARFNEFERAIDNDLGEEACSKALLFFMQYTDTHFRFEENIMDHYRCPARYVNRQEHEQFQKKVQEIAYMTWPLGATREDVLTLEEELVVWLKGHICGVDVKLRECVLDSGT